MALTHTHKTQPNIFVTSVLRSQDTAFKRSVFPTAPPPSRSNLFSWVDTGSFCTITSNYRGTTDGRVTPKYQWQAETMNSHNLCHLKLRLLTGNLKVESKVTPLTLRDPNRAKHNCTAKRYSSALYVQKMHSTVSAWYKTWALGSWVQIPVDALTCFSCMGSGLVMGHISVKTPT